MPIATRFDSSIGRGDFNVKIGIGRVIRGPSPAKRPPCAASTHADPIGSRLGRRHHRRGRQRGHVVRREGHPDHLEVCSWPEQTPHDAANQRPATMDMVPSAFFSRLLSNLPCPPCANSGTRGCRLPIRTRGPSYGLLMPQASPDRCNQSGGADNPFLS